MKYRSYVKDLPFLPRLMITALTGVILFVCVYLAVCTAYYLLSRYVKTSILAAIGLVNIYLVFPILRSQNGGYAKKAVKKPNLSPPPGTPAIMQPVQTIRPQMTAAPKTDSVEEATAPQLPEAVDGESTQELVHEVTPISFADVAREFTEKLNNGSAEEILSSSDFSDEDLGDEI